MKHYYIDETIFRNTGLLTIYDQNMNIVNPAFLDLENSTFEGKDYGAEFKLFTASNGMLSAREIPMTVGRRKELETKEGTDDSLKDLVTLLSRGPVKEENDPYYESKTPDKLSGHPYLLSLPKPIEVDSDKLIKFPFENSVSDYIRNSSNPIIKKLRESNVEEYLKDRKIIIDSIENNYGYYDSCVILNCTYKGSQYKNFNIGINSYELSYDSVLNIIDDKLKYLNVAPEPEEIEVQDIRNNYRYINNSDYCTLDPAPKNGSIKGTKVNNQGYPRSVATENSGYCTSLLTPFAFDPIENMVSKLDRLGVGNILATEGIIIMDQKSNSDNTILCLAKRLHDGSTDAGYRIVSLNVDIKNNASDEEILETIMDTIERFNMKERLI